jgi:hypothetical protein
LSFLPSLLTYLGTGSLIPHIAKYKRQRLSRMPKWAHICRPQVNTKVLRGVDMTGALLGWEESIFLETLVTGLDTLQEGLALQDRQMQQSS